MPVDKIRPFHFWAQKALPLVFDDALSYYEVLSKVVDYLNRTIAQVDENTEGYDELVKEFNELKSYTDNFLTSLDVQQEISEKLDDMASDGSLNTVILPVIAEYANPSFVSSTDDMTPTGNAYVFDLNQHVYTWDSAKHTYSDTGHIYGGTVYHPYDFTDTSKYYALASDGLLYAYDYENQQWSSTGLVFAGTRDAVQDMVPFGKVYVLTSDMHVYTWDGGQYADSGVVYGSSQAAFIWRKTLTSADSAVNLTQDGWYSFEFDNMPQNLPQFIAPSDGFILRFTDADSGFSHTVLKTDNGGSWLWNGVSWVSENENGFTACENCNSISWNSVCWCNASTSNAPTDEQGLLKTFAADGEKTQLFFDNENAWFRRNNNNWIRVVRDDEQEKNIRDMSALYDDISLVQTDTAIVREMLIKRVDDTNKALVNEKVERERGDEQNREYVNSIMRNTFTIVDVSLLTENDDVILTENSAVIVASVFAQITDKTLTKENFPADAKETGLKIDSAIDHMTNMLATAVSTITQEINIHDVTIANINNLNASQTEQIAALETVVEDIKNPALEKTEVTINTENDAPLLTEYGNTLYGTVWVVRTDATLSQPHTPADANAVGEAVSKANAAIAKAEYSAKNYADNLLYDWHDRLTQRFGNIAVTTLPILNLWGDTSKMSKNNKVTLSYLWQGKYGTCTCKWQGSSSINYPEKNYTVSFDRDFNYNNSWPHYHKWVFKSNWLDSTQARGISCARIWSNLVKTWANTYSNDDITDEAGNTLTTEQNTALQYPAYASPMKYAPNYGATDGFPCVVKINDEFVGLYTCQIPKDKYMFGMQGTKGEAVVNSVAYAFQVRLTEANFPSYLDIECATDDMTMSVIIESLNSIYDLLHGSTDGMMDRLAERMNLTCTIDYMLFSALLLNWDGIKRNWNLYTFDGGTHWNFSAYDLDNTCGNGWSYAYFFTMPGSWNNVNFSTSNPPLKSVTGNYLFNRIYTLYKPAIVERYNNISQNILTPNQVYYNHISFMKDIPLWLYLMDFKRWPTKPGTSMQTTGTIGTHVMMQAAALEREIAALQ